MRQRQVKVWRGTMESAPNVTSSYNLSIDMLFHAFAQSIQRQSPLRDAITTAWRQPEIVCVPPLLDQATLPPPQTARARTLAARLVEALRGKTPAGGVEGLIHEYALSSQEGVALMCLAEALLRIPDDGDARRADPRQDRRRRLAGASRPQPVAVRQRRDLGPAADRPADGDHQRTSLSSALDAPDRPRRRAADPQGRRSRPCA